MDTILSWILSVLLLAGCLFTVVAALGIVRLPDFFMRMHAATKAGAFGGSIILLVAGIGLGMVSVWIEAILVIVFFYLTMPVASHMIGRSAYRHRVQKWSGTRIDEIEGRGGWDAKG